MKTTIGLMIVLGSISIGCGDAKQMEQGSNNNSSDSSYDWMLQSDGSQATEGTPSEGNPESSPNRTECKKPNPEELFKAIDTDQSSSLSLDEFLARPKRPHPGKAEKSEEQLAKMKEQMTLDFNAKAGDDAVLSLDEFKSLMEEVKTRHKEHGPKGLNKNGPKGLKEHAKRKSDKAGLKNLKP